MRLRTKLNSPLIVLLLISGLFLHLYLLPTIHQELEEEFDASNLAVIQAISAASLPFLMTNNLAELYELLNKQLELHPHWISLSVTNNEGIRLYPIADLEATSSEYGHILQQEIQFGNQATGIIEVYVDSSVAVYEKDEAIALIGNLLLVGLALVIIAITWFQNYLVIRPISQLATAVRAIEQGKFDQIINFTNKDEIGELGEKFSEMRDSILNYKAVLLSESQRTQAVMHNLFDAVITADVHGNIKSVNHPVEKMFGFRQEELFNKNLKLIMSDQDASEHDRHLHNYSSTGKKNVIGREREATAKCKDGTEFPIELVVNQVKLGGEEIFIGVIRDVTQRKEVELAMKNQRMQIDTISQVQASFIATGNSAQLFSDLLSDVMEITKSQFGFIAEALYDDNDEPYIKSLAMNNLINEEKVDSFYYGNSHHGLEFHKLDNLFGSVILSGEVVLTNDPDTHEKYKPVPKGHPKLQAFLGIPLRLGKKVVGVIALANRPKGYDSKMIDVLQPALGTCAQLIDAVAKERDRKKIAEELLLAKEAAETAAKTKSQFLATMSHEIRTPMNGVLGMLHLLDKTELDTTQHRYLNTATGSGEMLLTVINDILDFSKLDSDNLELENIAFHPTLVVEETAALLAKTGHDKDLEIICSVDRKVPHEVIGDPTRLRQILINLLNNAIKFTEIGHVGIYVDFISGRLAFRVVDTGIGISKEQQQHLFQSFKQVDSSHTRKYGGTGLGLVISQRLVHAMGGELLVTSSAGLGSEFRFEIPLEVINHAGASEGHTAMFNTSMFNQLRMLIVDDNKISRVVINKMLASWQVGHIEEAQNGEIALEKLVEAQTNDKAFDIALLDMQMPCMNGIELAKNIRANKQMSELKLVMLGSADTRIDAPEFDIWVNKPVRYADLNQGLLQLLELPNEGSAYANHADEDTLLQEDVWFSEQRLLLVEDNKINQEVAQAILNDVGFKVDISENGADALAAVQKHHYDVVLMDIQMPIMDGFEATAKIRALGEPYASMPIIAMTAHALTGDADNSLEAGMNAHVTKPIDPKILFDTLSHWITSGGKNLTMNKNQTSKETVPSLPGIDIKAGLNRMRGNWQAYKRVLIGFRDKQAASIELIEAHILKGEWDEASRIAHSLKGSGGNISAELVFNDAAVLEQALRAGDSRASGTLLSALKFSLNQVISGLEGLDDESKAEFSENTTGGEIATSVLQDSLKKMLVLVDSDFNGAEILVKKLQHQVDGTKWVRSINELSVALSRLDVDTANAIAQDILDNTNDDRIEKN